MLEQIFSSFGRNGIHKVSWLYKICSEIIRSIDMEFKEEKGKNLAIDSIIDMLEKLKSLPRSNTPFPE